MRNKGVTVQFTKEQILLPPNLTFGEDYSPPDLTFSSVCHWGYTQLTQDLLLNQKQRLRGRSTSRLMKIKKWLDARLGAPRRNN